MFDIVLLFELLKICGFFIFNCIVMVLMMCLFFFGGVLGENVVDYYVCCGDVDVGLIIIEGMMVDCGGVFNDLCVLNFYKFDVLNGWLDVVFVVYKMLGKIVL